MLGRIAFRTLGLVAVGYIFAAVAGWVLNRIGIQGYPWDNLTMIAVLFALLLTFVQIYDEEGAN